MLTYSDAQALPWRGPLPRRQPRRAVLGATGRQAVRHGIRSAIQAGFLSVVVLAAAGILGARGPVVLSEPTQPAGVRAVAAQLSAAPSMGVSPKVTAKVTTR